MKNARTLYHAITGTANNTSMCPDLDFKTRVIGFVISFVAGIFMMISSISQLFTLALGGQRWFAIWYTCGNCVCLSSTFFLMGPKRQWQNMMKPERKMTSLVLIMSMFLSLVLAFTGISKMIIMIVIIVQFLALLWYVLSYIPGAQRLCSACIKSKISRNTDNGSYTEMV